MGSFSAFTAVLRAGTTPHAIHAHAEEEQIVVLSGELDAIIDDETHRIGPGGFCHFPADSRHIIRSIGPDDTTFLVFKWNWQPGESQPGSIFFTAEAMGPKGPGIDRHRICQDHPLANGSTLTAELIRIDAHSGYPLHTHDHDLMLIVLRGQLHGFHPPASAPSVIYYPAKTPHMMAPLHPEPTEMLALEFHRAD